MLTIEEITKLIEIDKNSIKKRKAKIAKRYYNAEHDILSYRLFYYNTDGELVEDNTRSNIKISHPFFTELVDQEVQYLLSDFSITSKIDKLKEELEDRFDDDFKSELSDTCEGATVKGYDYMYGYLGKDDKTRFKNADSLGVIEVRACEASDNVDHIIYYYIDRVDMKRRTIMKIEVWDKDFKYFYIKIGTDAIKIDENEEINPRPHKVYKSGEKYIYKESEPGYGTIPFFCLDNNKTQTSSLKPIKKIIDDYDLMNCGLSNNLQDVSDALYVVKGFKGDNLDQLQQNIKTKKMVGVDKDGDIDIKTIDIPYAARQIKLELDEKNIYKFGMGFNASQVGDGNITNIVIISRYTLLDLKCNKKEKYLRKLLKQLIQVALDEINQKYETDYTMKDVIVNLKRKIPTNEADNANVEKIKAETKQLSLNIILDAATKIDDETVIKSICELLDIEYDEVIKRLDDNKIDLNEASERLSEGVLIE